MTYYNEIDSFAAAWLRELIKDGHIAPGIVDERSVEDINPDELHQYSQCHFFAGIGAWSHALRAAGWPDDQPVWTGSCPCQPFSTAGKRAGVSDERHLWPAFFHLIEQCRPPVVFGEQVASKDGLQWLDLVSTDMEAAGYSFGASDLCAAGFGAPHIRQRLYFVAQRSGEPQELRNLGGLVYPEREGLERHNGDERHRGKPGRLTAEQIRSIGQAGGVGGFWRNADWIYCRDEKFRPVEPGTFPLAHGAPARVGRLRGYGNALVAPVAQGFISAAMEALDTAEVK